MVLLAVLVVVLVVGGVATLFIVTKDDATTPQVAAAASASLPDLGDPTPVLAALSSDAPAPTPDALAAQLTPLLASPALGTGVSAEVVDVATGESLFAADPTSPSTPASTAKLLTAVAALTTLDPADTLTTTVVQGSSPGEVVLVGGGDVTLSRTSSGDEGVYPGAAHLDDLAAQVRAAWDADPSNPPLTKLILDASYFGGDEWEPSWDPVEREDGYMSNVTALQVDGDRANPQKQDSPRSTDPIGRAGQAFLQALRDADTDGEVADDVAFTTGTAVSQANPLGEVASQPVRSIINYMLKVSDNTMAEMLARIVSKESALNGSAASLQQAIPSALFAGYQIPQAGLTIKDGSGLSEFNAVPPETVAQLLIQVNSRANNLDVIFDGLPVAGQSGTLASRFTGPNAVAAGKVVAKPGWLASEYSLGGTVIAADGTPLGFAFYAIRDGITRDARAALDDLPTGVFTCGDNLSNN